MPSKSKDSIQSDLQQLEAIVTKMDSGDIGLEESLSLFEQGINTVRKAQRQLDEAEQKLQLLLMQDDDTASTSDEPNDT